DVVGLEAQVLHRDRFAGLQDGGLAAAAVVAAAAGGGAGRERGRREERKKGARHVWERTTSRTTAAWSERPCASSVTGGPAAVHGPRARKRSIPCPPRSVKPGTRGAAMFMSPPSSAGAPPDHAVSAAPARARSWSVRASGC